MTPLQFAAVMVLASTAAGIVMVQAAWRMAGL